MGCITLFSIATPMVYYSTEFKQYMGDVFATVLLLYFFVVAKPKHTIWLAVLGAVILWFSHASLFILAAIALVNPSLWTVAVPVWLVSFGIDWWVALRFNLSDAVAIHWNGLFLLFPWQSDFDLISYFKIIGRMIGFFFDSDSGLLFTLLLGVGMVTLWKTRVRNFLVLMVPIGLVLLATGIQKYPFVPRLLLFLTPSLYIAVGAGFESILSVAKKMGGSVAKGLAIGIMGWIIFYGVVGGAWDHLTVPIKVEELGQVMSYLKQQYQANDLIYVYYAADAPFTFYAPQFGLDQVHHVIGIESRNDVGGYKKDLEQVRGHSRVWVIFSHIYRHSAYGEDRYITGYLDEIGKRLDYYPQVGASLYLYDLSDTVK